MGNYSFNNISQKWLQYCLYGRQDPITEQTYKSYAMVVELLGGLLGGCDIREVNQEHITRIRQYVFGRGRSAGYLHRLLSVLRSILRYCEDELQLPVLRPEKVKLPSKKRQNVEYLAPKQIEKLLKDIDLSTIQGIRTMAIVTSFLDSGMRISELCGLDRDSIQYEAENATVVGKGGVERIVYFSPWSLVWIRAYLSRRKDDHPALFIRHDPKLGPDRIKPDTVRKILYRLGKKVGIRANPHKWRRTASTLFWGNGADIKVVSIFLGHSSVQVTERYLGPNTERVRRELKRYRRYGMEHRFRPISLPAPRWAAQYRCCRLCRRTKIRHAARGFCYNCYMNKRNAQARALVVKGV